MNKYKKQIKRIIKIFQNGDPKMINILKYETKTRLNKYAAFNNRYLELNRHFYTNNDTIIKESSLFKRDGEKYIETFKGASEFYDKLLDLSEYYDHEGIAYKIARYECEMPDGIWMGSAEAAYTSDDIEYYENFIDDWADGNNDDIFGKEYRNLEDLGFDADATYIFLGTPCESKYKCPKPWETLSGIIYYISKRASWRNGLTTNYYSNGNPCSIGSYEYDLPIGDHTVFSFENDEELNMEYKDYLPWEGRTITEDNERFFIIDDYKKGKRHGSYIVYTIDGTISLKEEYVNGQRIMKSEYYDNGNIRFEGILEDGEIISSREFDENGRELKEEEIKSVYERLDEYEKKLNDEDES